MEIHNAALMTERGVLVSINSDSGEEIRHLNQEAAKAMKWGGIILSGTQAMPAGQDASYDEAYANPGKLHAAGVTIVFATFNSSASRTLPYEAALEAAIRWRSRRRSPTCSSWDAA